MKYRIAELIDGTFVIQRRAMPFLWVDSTFGVVEDLTEARAKVRRMLPNTPPPRQPIWRIVDR